MPNTRARRIVAPAAVLSLLACLGAGLPRPAAASAHAAASQPGPSRPLRWREVDLPSRGTALSALAVDPIRGQVAVGDTDGVLVRGPVEGRPEGGFRRAARVGGVTDLHFDSQGDLWIGTVSGLWHLDSAGRLEERSVARGEAGRWIRRVDSRQGLLLLATAAGASVSADGGPWQGLGGPLSTTPVQALASRTVDDHVEVWLASDLDLWRVRVDRRPGGVELDARRLDSIPGRPISVAPVDLVVDATGGAEAVLYPRHIAVSKVVSGARSWRVMPVALPPGASARRLAVVDGRWWIAHDRGLSSAPGPVGPWTRAESPAGSAESIQVAALDESLWLVSRDGLLLGEAAPRLRSTAGAARGRAFGIPPVGPPVRAVQRVALRYLDLGPEIARSRFRGLRRRGWLPVLALRFGISDEHDRAWEDDQAFISGDHRFLQDRDGSDGRDYEGSASLTWSLGDLAYDSDWDDLSREVRQVIALRDDVLDEVNQLYFERRRVLGSLAASEPESADTIALRLRADELSAGLDAWTGGWFGAQIASGAPGSVSPR